MESLRQPALDPLPERGAGSGSQKLSISSAIANQTPRQRRLLLMVVLGLAGLTSQAWGGGAVVFNEIMYHPRTNESTLEWVELHNQLAVDVDISNWSVENAIQFKFPAGTVIRGRGYLLLAIAPAALQAATGQTNVHGPFTGRLSNSGEEIELRNNSGRLMDSVDYGVEGDWPVGPDGSGFSLAKKDRDSASRFAGNWTASAQVGGTPGTGNFPLPGTVPPDTKLIRMEEVWRYDASGADLGTAWRTSGYDDSGWASGAAWFYHGSISAGESRPLATLFNTGLGTNGSVLSAGSPDPHYSLAVGAQGTPGAPGTVTQNHPAWLANDASSGWISVVNPGTTSINGGGYDYLTRFALDRILPGSVRLNFRIAVDNDVTNVLLNGLPLGIAHSGFSVFSPVFAVTNGFTAGTNTLEFRSVNQSTGPGGLRVEMDGTGAFVLTNTALPAGPVTYYFRRSFNLTGEVANTQLRLNTIVDDGAVFYLNGAEIHRQNMPPGIITAATPASSNVEFPVPSGEIVIPSESLVQGTNVLAVEVHQATDGGSDLLFGAELISTPVASPPVTLAFNELSSTTNAEFWLEVANHGTNAIQLDRYVIVRDGPTNSEYTFPADMILPPGGYLALTNSQLGFHPASGDKLLLMNDAKEELLDGVVVKTVLRGRSPDGTGQWYFPSAPSPGASNLFVFHDEIVINEIMYHHQLLPATNGLPPQESPETWLELFNRSTNAVNLTGWELTGGISYQFAPGTTIGAGGYLVVADDAAALRALHPAFNIVGDYGGRLSTGSDRIVLKDPLGNPADEVTYHDQGRWPEYADGGGSSLELRDPHADNSAAEAWAASLESGKSSWQNYSYRMVAAIPSGSGQPTTWNDFILGLLSNGECLIDDLSVVESPTNNPIQLVANGDFENGLAGWRAVGTHGRSAVIADPDNPGNQVLHIIASGAQEHMHNHIETTYAGGRTVVNGREYEISFRARWLAGNNLFNTRLYFNRAARTTALPTPPLNGTPGAQNSTHQANIGPTFSQMDHQPVIPSAAKPVTVSVQARDPQGVVSCVLWWSADGGAWSNAPMTAQGDGRYAGAIPGQAAGTIVQFFVQAVDGLGAAATFPALGPDSGALYAVADGQAMLDLAHNIRLILSPANRDLLHAFTNVMSNDLLPCTVIYDEQRAYYDCRVHLRGSQRGRYSDTRTGFHINFPPDDLFRGVHPVMLIDRSGAGDATENRQEEILIKHILNRAGGIPGTYGEICRVIAPRSAHTGAAQFFPRHEDVFIETAFENGGDGTMFEMELIYYPTSANAGGYKNPQPDEVVGTDVTNLGSDKELYRYNFMIKNHRDTDDYSRFVALAKAWSLTGAALDAETRELMDIDEWMRAYALASLCSVGDMYTFGNNHNFFMYVRHSDGKFLYFPWDMDFAFSRGSSGALVGDQNLGKIVNLPGNLRCLYAHMLDIINVSFNTNYMAYWTAHYTNFAPGQNYSGSLTTIGQRTTFVKNQINRSATNSFLVAGTNFLVTSSNVVAFSGRAPVQVKDITINGLSYPVTWSFTSANVPTTWTIRLVAETGTNVYVVQGYDRQGQALTNALATNTVVYTGPEPVAEGAVVINEIMYHPPNPDAAFVEIFNTSTNFSFDLSGWRLDGVDFVFPMGTVLGSRQWLAVVRERTAFAVAYGASIPVAGEFGGELDLQGETLSLLRPGPGGSEVVVDRVRYEAAAPWAAGADGSGRSLQLIDATRDNSRVSNWSDGTAGWRFFSVTGTANGSRLNLWLNSAGDFYLDDMALVAGNVPESGPNLLFNGDFESALSGPWVIPVNATNTAITSAVTHSGAGSLQVMFTSAGGTASTSIYQDAMPLVTNNTYTLSFWYLPGGSGNNLTVRMSTTFQGTLSIKPVLNTPGSNNVPVASLPAYPALWLNEVQANNVSGAADGQGEREPWVELFNAGTNSLSLDGLYLAQQYSNLTQWAFPAGRSIGPGEFLVVWADGETNETPELHTNFRLQNPTGSVALARLVQGEPQIVDYLNYTGLGPDQSYGDFPDGQPFERRVLERPTPGTSNGAPPAIFINEWMAANTSFVMDPADGDFDDWFELYNAGPQAVDLSGYYLTDNLADKTQWAIPTGTLIAAGGHLLVWADGETNQNGGANLHASFQLSKGGEAIGLFAPDGTLIDAVTFTNQTNNVSQGRWPDGGAIDYLAQPSPGTGNSRPINQAPVLAGIADRVVAPEKRLLITNTATDVHGDALSYRLGPGAPAGAKINATNGLFSWIPLRGQAPSTNQIQVIVSDDGTPSLSVTQGFEVVVGHWLELSVGTNIMRTGESGSVPLQLYSTAGLTNLEFGLQTGTDHLTNWILQPTVPAVSTSVLETLSTTQMVIRFGAEQAWTGTQQLGQLQFQAQSNRVSAFVPLRLLVLEALGPGQSVTNHFVRNGRVVVIGEEPLLEANPPGAGGAATVTVFGKPGTNYVVERATNWTESPIWTPAFELTLDGLFKVSDPQPDPAGPILYRAREK